MEEMKYPPVNLASPTVVKELLNMEGIRPRRSMGQNFLVDSNILRIIAEAAGLSRSDAVIEVGAGLGALTRVLTENCSSVFALESDHRLAGILKRELGSAENLRIVEADAARFDYSTIWSKERPGQVKMVANLPYQIAATLLVDCLYRYPWIKEYTVMVQREIADRFTSSPGSRDYSSATVKVLRMATVQKIARVSRNSFYPKPRVDSTILRINRRTGVDRPERPGMEQFFNLIVTASFQQRRKKLVNSLATSSGPALDRAQIRDSLIMMGKDPGCRAEELSPEDFIMLAGFLENWC